MFNHLADCCEITDLAIWLFWGEKWAHSGCYEPSAIMWVIKSTWIWIQLNPGTGGHRWRWQRAGVIGQHVCRTPPSIMCNIQTHSGGNTRLQFQETAIKIAKMYLASSPCDDGPTSLQVDPRLLSILRHLAVEVVSEVWCVLCPPTSSCLQLVGGQTSALNFRVGWKLCVH